MRAAFAKIVVLQIVLALYFGYNIASKAKFTNAVCKVYNSSWISVHNCRLRAVNRNKTVFNFNGTFLHPAYNIKGQIQMFKKVNGYKPWLIKTEFDVCRYLRKPYNPFVRLIYAQFQEFSNFNHTCPYVGSQIVSGFYPRPELLVSHQLLPTDEYLITFTWLFDNKPQMATNFYFSFVED